VLRTQWRDKEWAVFILKSGTIQRSYNTYAAELGILINNLKPEERPDRFGTKEDTNVWIEYIAKSVKEPTMRINLFRNPTNERKLKNQVSLKRYSILQKLSYETEFFICDEPVVKLKIERENGNETSQRWQIIGFFEVVGNALINDNSFKNDDLIKLLKVDINLKRYTKRPQWFKIIYGTTGTAGRYSQWYNPVIYGLASISLSSRRMEP
ncbi:4255_t:CDS:2, partial [Rhizophagus irregularis]